MLLGIDKCLHLVSLAPEGVLLFFSLPQFIFKCPYQASIVIVVLLHSMQLLLKASFLIDCYSLLMRFFLQVTLCRLDLLEEEACVCEHFDEVIVASFDFAYDVLFVLGI